MSSSTHGKTTSPIEVTHISSHGFWLLAHDKELFLPFEHFPWFQDQPVKAILDVQEPSPGHFYWPAIDVDLTEQIIEHPDRYPKLARK